MRLLALLGTIAAVVGCSSPHHGASHPARSSSSSPSAIGPQPAAAVQVWLTTASGSSLLARQQSPSLGSAGGAGTVPITVNDASEFQQFWGVGASITGASAQLLSQLPAADRDRAMTSLFSRQDGIGLSVLRQPVGANDFSIGSSSYDDVPVGSQDPGLQHFSLGGDRGLVLPLLSRAHQLNPAATAVLTPWSAPAWMKTNGALVGGSLSDSAIPHYADYLVRAVREYAGSGMPVGGLSVQNEPSFSPAGYPGMLLSVAQQARVIRAVASALSTAGLTGTRIWALDDNYDRTADAQQLLDDPTTRSAVGGVAFHCYRGDTGQLAAFHAHNPSEPLAISECTGGDWSPQFGSDLRYDVQNLIIDGIRNGVSWLSKWNIALDPADGPTNGGCTSCRGLITIDPATHSVVPSEAFYAFGHLGKFVVPGARVIASSSYGTSGIETVAFRNPDSSHVLVAFNAGSADNTLAVSAGATNFDYRLTAGSVATFSW